MAQLNLNLVEGWETSEYPPCSRVKIPAQEEEGREGPLFGKLQGAFESPRSELASVEHPGLAIMSYLSREIFRVGLGLSVRGGMVGTASTCASSCAVPVVLVLAFLEEV